MRRTHKIRLAPTAAQAAVLERTSGTARYVYNWALSEWNEWYADFKAGRRADRPSAIKLSALWTKTRPTWTKDISRGVQTQAILNVGVAFTNFWKHKAAIPSFKKKGLCDSFYVDNGKANICGSRIQLPYIGSVRLRETLRFIGRVVSYTITRSAGEWYVSVLVDCDEAPRLVNTKIAGVDVGCKTLAVASDGTVCENPKGLAKYQRKLAHLQRELARRQKGSNRRAKTKLRIAKIHKHIKNQRDDNIHKFTTEIAKNHGTVVVETLDVKEMREKAKGQLARSLQDTAMREVHRQLEYKVAKLERASRFYPSSKTCSSCGDVKASLPLDVRTYKCACGLSLDRDLNAARNLRNRRWVTASSRVEGPKASAKREAEMEAFGF